MSLPTFTGCTIPYHPVLYYPKSCVILCHIIPDYIKKVLVLELTVPE